MVVHYSPLMDALSVIMFVMAFFLAMAATTFPVWLPELLEYLTERRRDRREERRRDELHQAQLDAARSQAVPGVPDSAGRVVVEVVHHLPNLQTPALAAPRIDGQGNQWLEVAPGRWQVVKPTGTAIERRR